MSSHDDHNIERRSFLSKTSKVLIGGAAVLAGSALGEHNLVEGAERKKQSSRRTRPGTSARRSRLSQTHVRGTGGIRPTAREIAESRRIDPVSLEGRRIDPGQVVSASHLPLVEDQGLRGTCVAFAFTVLNEQAQRRRGNVVELSQQHLYDECKQIDNLGCDGGTYMRSASTVLSSIGQCTASLCPYHRTDCGLGSVSRDVARREAANHRLRTTRINPNDTDGIKAILQRGWPVAVLIDTYQGWTSDEVWRTGEMTMPPSNIPDTPHAVCLIGYTENPMMPFPQGFYLFRNSWGVEFGRECSLGRQSFARQGNGKMPIEYIIEHCLDAYAPSDALA